MPRASDFHKRKLIAEINLRQPSELPEGKERPVSMARLKANARLSAGSLFKTLK